MSLHLPRRRTTTSKIRTVTFDRRLLTLKLLLLSLLMFSSSLAPRAFADDSIWLSGGEIKRETSNRGNDAQDCSPVPIEFLNSDNDMLTKTTSCVVTGKYFSLAGNGRALIKFNSDSYYHELLFDGQSINLLPNSDTLITKRWGGVEQTQMAIYRDAAKSIKVYDRIMNFGAVKRYIISAASGYKVFPRADNPDYQNAVQEYAVTPDQRYMVAYMNNETYVKINMATMQADVLYVHKTGPYPYRPFSSVAISDDGRYVFLGRIFKLLDTNGCGDSWYEKYVEKNQYNMAKPCRSIDLQSNLWGAFTDTNSFNTSKFVDNGNGLEVIASTNSTPYYKKIALYRPGYTPPTLDYLALGDSISSGEGDIFRDASGKTYYRRYTDVSEDKAKLQPEEKCHLSTHSYPYLLAITMNLALDNPKQWNSVACSGATTGDMASGNTYSYSGQKNSNKAPRLDGYINKDALQTQALNEFIPGRIQQIEFVRKYKPKVITLTAGANDIDFAGKLDRCVRPQGGILETTCDWATTQKPKLGQLIHDDYDSLVKLYGDLYAASGNQAKIYVFGYPEMISDETNTNCNDRFLNQVERTMITQATRYMNKVISSAARTAGVKYIDISHSLYGGRVCEAPGLYQDSQSANGVSSYSDYFLMKGNKLAEEEMFHPNLYGQIKIAQTFMKALDGKSPLLYDICPAGATICPDTSNPTIDIPPEFGGTSAPMSMMDMTQPVLDRGTRVVIHLPDYIAEPNSRLSVSLDWGIVALGYITTNTRGGGDLEVQLPNDLHLGLANLTVIGKTYSGEQVSFLQGVVIANSDHADLDGNGTKDSLQACGPFVTPSGKDVDLDGIDDACDPEIGRPVLYMARNGLALFNQDPAKIYLYRNSRAYDKTRVYGDWVNRSQDPSNNYALVATSLTDDTKATYNKLVFTWSGQQPVPIVLAKGSGGICLAFQPSDLGRTWEPTSPYYKPRGFTKLNALPQGANCE